MPKRLTGWLYSLNARGIHSRSTLQPTHEYQFVIAYSVHTR